MDWEVEGQVDFGYWGQGVDSFLVSNAAHISHARLEKSAFKGPKNHPDTAGSRAVPPGPALDLVWTDPLPRLPLPLIYRMVGICKFIEFYFRLVSNWV